MKEKLQRHFLRWGAGRFVAVTVLLLFVTDLLNCWYLRLYWTHKKMSVMLVHQSIARGGLMLEDFSKNTLEEMTGFVNNMFYFFLFIIMANNLFFYIFYLKKRLWAQGFVLFYTLTAALFSLTFVLDNAGLGAGWMAYNILSIPFYIYFFLGIKLLKEETTLVREKKGL